MATKNIGTPEERERKYDKKYIMLHLDKEIYGFNEKMTTYIIITPKELEIIKRNTLKRMVEYNKMIPEFGGYMQEDIDKLKESD